jgi:hypothetical protein
VRPTMRHLARLEVVSGTFVEQVNLAIPAI